MTRIWLAVTLLALATACEPKLSPPPGAQLECTASEQCPSGFVCRENIGRCVPADSLGNTTPPALLGTPTVTPALGRGGTTFQVSFEVSETLAETPVVTAEMKTETAKWTLSAAESSGNRYVFNYAATGNEPEGVVKLFVDLLDVDGNPAKGIALPSVVLDFTAPSLVAAEASPSSAKSGDLLAYSVSVSEKLSSPPQLVVKKGGVVEPDFFGAKVTSTDSHFVFTRNISGALDGAYTVELSLSDEAGNAAGPLQGGGFTIDSSIPQISNLTVAPGRVKSGGTVTVTFDSTENVSGAGGGSGVDVKLGANAMSCAAFQQSSPNYTCTYSVTGSEIAANTESAQTVLVKLSDAAGNRAETAGSVVLDFKAPSLVSSTPSPTVAKSGDVLVYTVNVSEKLQGAPTLVVKKGGTTQTGFFGATTTASDTSFTWSKTLSGALDGTYTVEVSLTDEAGNAASALAGTGFGIDTTPPVISGLAVPTTPLKSGATVIVSFDSSEQLPSASVIATVGGNAMSCGAYSATSPNYTCTYSVTGSEIAANSEAPQSVLVKLLDAAGNRAEAANSVTFDFRAPTLVSTSPSPASAKSGDTLRYTVNVSEPLSGTPTVTVKKNGAVQSNFFGAPQANTATNFVFQAAITSQADGAYTVELSFTDAAGNPSGTLSGAGFSLDASVPAVSALSVSPARVKAGDTLTATFDASEDVGSLGVSVTVGTRAMSCGPYQPTSPNHTCTLVIAASDGTASAEVSRSVVVKVTDGAGNRGESIGTVTVDLKAPTLVSSSANPPSAKSGDVLVYTVNVSEKLQGTPSLTVKKAGVTQAGFFGATTSASDTSFTWAKTLSGSLDGTYTVELTMTDEVGNASGTLSAAGFTVDTTPPVISALTVPTTPLKAGTTVAITFSSSEPLPTSSITATVGGRAMTCTANTATSYTCTYLVAGTETSGAPQSVLVKLVDAAGNRAEAADSVTFDFLAPTLVGTSPSPANAKSGDTLRYTVNVSEPISGTPSVTVKKNGVVQSNFFGAPQANTVTNFTYQAVIASQPDGAYTVELSFTDAAGNPSGTLTGAGFGIDSSVPVASSISVAPARVKAGATLTVSFNTSEQLSSGGVVVTVGAQTMSCGAYSATQPNYVCTYAVQGNELSGEAPQTVLVKLADASNNRSEAASTVTFDFQAPTLASSTPSPAVAKLNDTLRYTVNVSEPLSLLPTLVVKKNGVTQPNFFGAPTTTTPTSFVFQTAIVAQPDGVYTVELAFADSAGNPSGTVSGASFTVDATVPQLSNLSVSPARAKAGDTVTVTFNSTENVSGAGGGSGVDVKLGSYAMGCSAYSATSPNYSCSIGVAVGYIPANTEAPMTVLVKATDAAGNRGEASDTVTLDFKAPTTVSTSASPTFAKSGDVLTYSVNASELLSGAPTLVVKKAGVTQPGFFGTMGVSGTNYTWSKNISGALDGSYTVDITMTDVAGNVSSVISGATFAIDSSVPVVSNVVVTPARVKAGGTVTVRFDSSEQVAAPGVVATVGALNLSCGAWAATSPNYTCTYSVSGTEIASGTEALQSVLVKLTDAAGNRSEGSGTVTFDFKNPTVVTTNASPSVAKSGDTLAYSVNVSEPLASAPTLVVKKAGVVQSGFFGTPASATGTNYLWTKSVTGPLDGSYTVELSFNDAAGNPSGTISGAGFSIDSTIPLVTGLLATPDRVSSGSVVLMTIEVSEQPPATGFVVTVAGQPASCSAYQAASPNYTCNYTVQGSENGGAGEASQTVLVKIADAAGNQSERSTGVVFDFQGPSIVSTLASPSFAKLGDELTYRMTASENLMAAPTPVVKYGGVVQSGFFGPPTTSSGNYFVWTKNIAAGLPNGSYTVEFNLTDVAGNGSFVVGSGFALDTVAPAITNVNVSPARARAGDVVVVTFNSSESVAPSGLSVLVGQGVASCSPYSGLAPNYTCTYTVNGGEIPPNSEGAQTISVRLTDAAGNQSTQFSSVMFDFRPPGVALASVVYTPDPAKNRLSLVTAARVGTKISVRVAPDEPLGSGSVPTMTASFAGATLYFSGAMMGDGSVLFELVLPSVQPAPAPSVPYPDGLYAPVISWRDVAGNSTSSATFGSPQISVKTSIPTVNINQSQVTFLRSPWGNQNTEVFGGTWTIVGGPYFGIEPANPLSGGLTLPASAFTMTGGQLTRVLVFGDPALYSQLGTLAPNTDGTWPRAQLANSDTPAAYVMGIDEAGNESSNLPAIQNVEWVATPKTPQFGQSPHLVRTHRFAEKAALPNWTGTEEYSAGEAEGSDTASVFTSGNVRWDERVNTPWPGQRFAFSTAFDSARGRWVLFGGEDGAIKTNELYEWDGLRWQNRTPSPLPPSWPSARSGQAMAYDSSRGRVVMFGGYDSNSVLQRELWEWDGTTWTNRTPTTLPPNWPSGRLGPSIAFDAARQKLMLFGGYDITAPALRNDLWEWDGNAWTDLTPSPLPANWPSVRYGHVIAWRPASGRLLMYGGSTGGVFYADLWEWNPATASWTNLTPGTLPPNWPPKRAAFAGSYDHGRDRFVIFGGVDGTTKKQDLWEWNPVLASWTDRTPSPIPSSWPAARNSLAMAYDGHRGVNTFFGGLPQVGSIPFNQLFEWDGTRMAERTMVPDVSPSPRAGPAIAWDSSRGRAVLFGGEIISSPNVVTNELWEWDGSKWANRTPSPLPANWPPAREDASMTFDSSRGRVVLFGGRSSTGIINLRDVWEWDGTTWFNRTPSPLPAVWPVEREGARMAYDSIRQRVMMFGGFNPTLNDLNELWEWNGSLGTWTSRTPVSPWPANRSFLSLTYDPGRDRLVLFGGRAGSFPQQDLWEWNGSAWTNRTPFPLPAAWPTNRSEHTMVYDSTRSRMVVFGGLGASGISRNNEVWDWDGASGTWANKTPVSKHVSWPTPLTAHMMVYDPIRKRSLLYGGFNDGGNQRRTYELDMNPLRSPAVTFVASMNGAGIPTQNITKLTVRAHCGGTSFPYTSGAGAVLEGWSTGGTGANPGEWLALATNSTATNTANPPYYLPAPPSAFVGWSSTSAAEALRYIMKADGLLPFRCRSLGTSGTHANDATVALDYIDVRVRYQVP